MKRVIAYIDGFNLYYGLRQKGWRWYYWLNVQTLAERLLKPGQVLAATKYFTSVLLDPPERRDPQVTHLDALQTLEDTQIFLGHFLSDTQVCNDCGHSHPTYHEKMTDVNIATEMMTDAFQDRFDVALLITGDGDLAGTVSSIRRLFPKKSVVVAFPPQRVSETLKRTASEYTNIKLDSLRESALPDRIIKRDGLALQRPISWR